MPHSALPKDPRSWSTAYSPLVLDHFSRPRNAGMLSPGPEVIRSQAGSRANGAEVVLTLHVAKGRVEETRFLAWGCPHFLAAASLLTEQLQGLNASELATWSGRGVGQDLDFPVEKRGRLLILEDAVRAAAQYLSP